MRKRYMLCILILFLFVACGSEENESRPERPADLFNQQEVGSAAARYESTVFIPDVEAFSHFEDLLSLFPASTVQSNNVAHGGTLNIGVVRDSQNSSNTEFVGNFHTIIAQTIPDRIVTNIITPSLYPTDKNGRIILGDNHSGPVIVDFDFDLLRKTLVIREGVYITWADGVPLTLACIVAHYYYVANVRQIIRPTDYWINIQGIYEFRYHGANHIQGLILSDDGRTLIIQYNQFYTRMMYCVNMSFPFAKHRAGSFFVNHVINWDTISRDELLASNIGFGPFLLTEYIDGERAVLTANEFYWQGRPILDRIVVHSVTQSEAVTMLLNGELDIIDIRDTDMETFENNDFNFLSTASNQQAMLYFNLGAMVDLTAAGHAVLPEHRPRTDEHPITNPDFRRAVSLAIDNQAIIELLLGHGLAAPATSILHPYNALSFIDPSSAGTAMLHVDAANALLDQLGLRWGDDGYRLNAYLETLYVNIAIPRMQANEALFEILQSNMRGIGIELRPFFVLPGSLMYQNAIIMQSRNNNVNHPMHMFLIFDEVPEIPLPAWDAAAPWGYSVNNLGGFNNDAANQIFSELNAVQLRSDNELRTLYQNWDQLFQEYVPAIPLFWQLDIQAVNRNVINYTRTRGVYHETALQWHRVGFIAE